MSADAVVPHRIETPESELADLRARLLATRWPERETVADWSQGVPLAVVQELCAYWATDYDWRSTERRLNRQPHFRTTVDGLPIHFVHLRSSEPAAVPIILTHGWPGSFLEFEQVMTRLTDGPEACHVVVPSLPGYGLSGRPPTAGWDVHRIARAWAELMRRLGYDRFLAGGSDWGTSVSTSLALQHPDRILGLHLVPPLVPPLPAGGSTPTDAEGSAMQELAERSRTGSAYSAVHGTRPQTIGYSLVDSPSGLCAWILEKIWSWADHQGDLYQVLSRDQVLDNITLYWLSGTGAAAARLYWESIGQVTAWFTDDVADTVQAPTGCTVFPREVPRPSRRLASRRFTNIVHWGEPDRGGHFGAWEQPDLFAREVRAVARAVQRVDGRTDPGGAHPSG